MDMQTASNKLSQLDINFNIGQLSVSVLWFRVMQAKNSWNISRHMHSSYEFHFVRGGSCRVQLDDSTFTAHEGQFYLTAPGVFHEQTYVDSSLHIEYSINYDLTLGTDASTEESLLFQTLSMAACKPTEDLYGAILCFEQALQEAETESLGYYNNIKSLAAMILISATRSFVDTPVSKYTVPKRTAKDSYRFSQIKQYIEDNLCVNISSQDLKNHIYLSEKQICRIILLHTGKTTRQYINFIRLQHAKSLLATTNNSIREISEQLGFTSEYYFNQFFKREEGYPPGLFRNNVQKP